MATLAMKKPFCIGKDDGDPPLMGHAPLKNAEVPNAGDFVYKSSGDIAECGADPANIAGIMAHEYNETYGGTFTGGTDLLQSTANSDMNYYRADAANRFIGCLGGKTLARTDEGTLYGVAKDGDGVWYVDGSDTNATRVRVLRIFNDDQHGLIGDTNAQVLFQFASNYQP